MSRAKLGEASVEELLMPIQTSAQRDIFEVSYLEPGRSVPTQEQLRDAWPADLDLASDQILEEYEGRGAEVLEIRFLPADWPARPARSCYRNPRF